MRSAVERQSEEAEKAVRDIRRANRRQYSAEEKSGSCPLCRTRDGKYVFRLFNGILCDTCVEKARWFKSRQYFWLLRRALEEMHQHRKSGARARSLRLV